jgi:hypothetical protein
MTTTTISLNKLFAWDGNVRKTESDKAISELAASIGRHAERRVDQDCLGFEKGDTTLRG